MQASCMDPLPLLLARLGRVIRSRRERTGLSQERFGFSVGVHRTYMGHLERGTANPTVKALFQVAQGLGLSVTELFALASGVEGDAVPDGPRSERGGRQPNPSADHAEVEPLRRTQHDGVECRIREGAVECRARRHCVPPAFVERERRPITVHG